MVSRGSWFPTPHAVDGFLKWLEDVVEPGNVFGVSEEEEAAGFEEADNAAEEEVLGFALEVDEGIAKEDDVEGAG